MSSAEKKVEVQLVKLLPEQAPESYKFGSAYASILVTDDSLGAEVSISDAMPDTNLDIYLVFDYGTAKARYVKLGAIVTDKEGKGQFRGLNKFDPGDHVVGLMIEDSTNFKGASRATLASVPMFNNVTLKAGQSG